ncbi:MAG: hypothetical protein ACRC5C_05180 [Bacilli bacterium]
MVVELENQKDSRIWSADTSFIVCVDPTDADIVEAFAHERTLIVVSGAVDVTTLKARVAHVQQQVPSTKRVYVESFDTIQTAHLCDEEISVVVSASTLLRPEVIRWLRQATWFQKNDRLVVTSQDAETLQRAVAECHMSLTLTAIETSEQLFTALLLRGDGELETLICSSALRLLKQEATIEVSSTSHAEQIEQLVDEIMILKDAQIEFMKQLQQAYEREEKYLTDLETVSNQYHVLRRSRFGRIQTKLWSLKSKLRNRMKR